MRLGPLACAAATALLALTACSQSPERPSGADEPVDVAPPLQGDCRVLTPVDIAASSDDTEPTPCTQAHTAQTFLVREFSGKRAEADYDDPALGAEVFEGCSQGFDRFTGANESLALRSVLSWAWFRASEEAWDAGARWYRCDVVGGSEDSAELVGLPRTARGLLLGLPADPWMACVDGDTVADVPWVPCSETHTWRAVSAIVVGEPEDAYPGDRLVEVLTRDYCSDWVGAWMNYPVDFEFAYTWFHRGEWLAGNRRSICWAKTDA